MCARKRSVKYRKELLIGGTPHFCNQQQQIGNEVETTQFETEHCLWLVVQKKSYILVNKKEEKLNQKVSLMRKNINPRYVEKEIIVCE